MNLLEGWRKVALGFEDDGNELQYQREVERAKPLLHTPLDPALDALTEPHNRFRAGRSLRDVEPSVNLFVHALTGSGDGAALSED